MSERKYSVSELDNLRRVVERKWLWGYYTPQMHSGCSRGYKEAEKTKSVEELVRTHMLAGHTAEDLLASEQSSNNSNNGTDNG